MTIHEMIAVLEGARDGKPVQKRLIVGMAGGQLPEWETMCNQRFNFHAYDYRVKPTPREFYICKETSRAILVPAIRDLDPHNFIHVREVLV